MTDSGHPDDGHWLSRRRILVAQMADTNARLFKHGYIYPDKQNYHLYAKSYNYAYRVAIVGMKSTFNGLLTNTSLIPIALTKVKI
jgi:hypothetical protein